MIPRAGLTGAEPGIERESKLLTKESSFTKTTKSRAGDAAALVLVFVLVYPHAWDVIQRPRENLPTWISPRVYRGFIAL